MSGSTFPADVHGAIALKKTEDADLVEGETINETLAPGTYDKAAVLALIGAGSNILELNFVVRSGTADFTLGGGTVDNYPAGASFTYTQHAGFKMPDFSLVVDATSEVVLFALAS